MSFDWTDTCKTFTNILWCFAWRKGWRTCLCFYRIRAWKTHFYFILSAWWNWVLPWWLSGQRWHTQHASGLQVVLESGACSPFPWPAKGENNLIIVVHLKPKKSTKNGCFLKSFIWRFFSLTSLKSLCSMKTVRVKGTVWLPLASSAGKSGTRTSVWKRSQKDYFLLKYNVKEYTRSSNLFYKQCTNLEVLRKVRYGDFEWF